MTCRQVPDSAAQILTVVSGEDVMAISWTDNNDKVMPAAASSKLFVMRNSNLFGMVDCTSDLLAVAFQCGDDLFCVFLEDNAILVRPTYVQKKFMDVGLLFYYFISHSQDNRKPIVLEWTVAMSALANIAV